MRIERNIALLLTLAALLTASPRVQARYTRSPTLAPFLEPIREKYDLPALAAAVIVDGKTAAWDATGFRRYGTDVRVTAEDKFHIGSCTKAMTATLVAMLVDRGKLSWDTTLAQALPELAEDMHPDYRDVTLRHLLAHRAGLAPSDRSWPKEKSFMDMHNLPGTATDQRLAYAKMMLAQEPEAKPGEKYIYSNAGYSILGLIAERAMNKPWETLMKEMLFEPLHMGSAGSGAMGTPGSIRQPWQHRMENGKVQPIEPGPLSDNPLVLAPAGTVHCSMRHWAAFVAAHLDGPKGKGGLLEPDTFKVLHDPDFGGNYSGGWQITHRQWADGKVLTHTGSNNMNFAVVWMAPKRNFAVLVASNQGGGDVAKACDEAAWALIKKFFLKE
ncbi:MAG: beta-lactamase family protein [Sedimentisphaerales bacterium]|nr:beta-lactamase family protein [Sedimentisphaerales bacterium]